MIQYSYGWKKYTCNYKLERAKHWRKRSSAKNKRGIIPCLKSLYKKRKSVNTLEIWYRVTKDNIPRDEESQDLRILAHNITCLFPFSFSLSSRSNFDHHEKELLYNQPNIVIYSWLYNIFCTIVISKDKHFFFSLSSRTNFYHKKEKLKGINQKLHNNFPFPFFPFHFPLDRPIFAIERNILSR